VELSTTGVASSYYLIEFSERVVESLGLATNAAIFPFAKTYSNKWSLSDSAEYDPVSFVINVIIAAVLFFKTQACTENVCDSTMPAISIAIS
jgi:hypothetical protein